MGTAVILQPGRLAKWVLAFGTVVAIALLVLDYLVAFGRSGGIPALRTLFNVVSEDGIGSWFATSQTLMVAVTIWLIYRCVGHSHRQTWKPVGWLVLFALFAYLAFDDGTMLHERLGSTWRYLMLKAGVSASFYPSYAWQLLFLPAFGTLGVFALVFLWRELGTRRSRVLLTTAFSCFLAAGALDFMEGLRADHPWNIYTWFVERHDLMAWSRERFDAVPMDALRHFSMSLEETLELLGMTFLWYVLLRHFEYVASPLWFRVASRAREATSRK